MLVYAMSITEELHGKLRGLLSELAENFEQVTQDNLVDNHTRSKLLTHAWDAVKWDLCILDLTDRPLSAGIRLAAIEVWRYNNFLEMPDCPERASALAPANHPLRVTIALRMAREELASYLDVSAPT